MGLIPQLTDAGKAMMVKAMTGKNLNFTAVKLGDANAPSTLKSGDYWYDTENNTLYQYMDTWRVSQTGITVATSSPSAAEAEVGDLWYNPTTEALYKCNNGWVESTAKITCATSAPEEPTIGDHWYDTANDIFYQRRNLWSSLPSVRISCGAVAPTAPRMGAYWYNPTDNTLKVCKAAWHENSAIVIAIGGTAPENPNEGDYWYDAESGKLKACSITTTESTEESGEPTVLIHWSVSTQPFTAAAAAPTSAKFGDWWYDTESSVTKECVPEWENDTTHTFTYGSIAPENPNEGDWWYDTSLHVYGQAWAAEREQAFTYGSAAPLRVKEEDWWYSTTNNVLYSYGRQWATNEGEPFTYGSKRPTIGINGDWWYDTSNKTLMEFASGWFADGNRAFTYSSAPPQTPTTGDWWYNSTAAQLYEFTGAQWVANYSTITCSISQPNTAEALTDLINPIMVAPITEILKGSNYVSLTTLLSNNELGEGFQWSETGVFAQIEGEEEELYAYCNAGELYDYIPSNDSGRTLNEVFTLLVMVGDAKDVSATIGEGALYATKAALEEHVRDGENPHNVTAEQVGLGNVPNTAPKDTPIPFEAAKALTEIQSDETMGTLFGKIKTAISTLILHLKAQNPHSITADKIGAADKKHEHYVMGTFTGNGTVKRFINLGFTPSAIFLCNGRGMTGDDIDGVCGGLAIGRYGLRPRNCTAVSHESTWSDTHTALLITTNGFYVNYYAASSSAGKISTNVNGETYRYIAFK